MTDILAGNTDPRQNPIWAEKLALRTARAAQRRPAAAKTGTTNDARDLGTYGFLPDRPRTALGLAVGVWMGNSDHSYPRSREPATSLTAAAPLWRAFVRDYTARLAGRRRSSGPKDVVRTTIDAWSGGRPGPGRATRPRSGSSAARSRARASAIDQDGLLYRAACGGWRVDPVKAELGPVGLAGRRPGLAAAGAARRRRRRPATTRDRLLLGRGLVGRPADTGRATAAP